MKRAFPPVRRARRLVVSAVLFSAACSDSKSTPTDAGTSPSDARVGVQCPAPKALDDVPANKTATNCAALPVAGAPKKLAHVPRSEDFTFDNQGYLLGIHPMTRWLTRTPYTGTPENIIEVGQPGTGFVNSWTRGSRLLPSGCELMVSDPVSKSVYRVITNSSPDVITVATGLPDPNGIAVHRDGSLWVANMTGEIWRMDPQTGAHTIAVQGTAEDRFDGLSFTPDYSALWFSEETSRDVNKVSLSGGGEPVTTVNKVTTIPEGPSTGAPFALGLDGMAVDECGNGYVVFMTGDIYRLKPDGTVEIAVTIPDDGMSTGFLKGPLPTAVNFGSGIGGWKADHLYVMSIQNGLWEVPLGIRGKNEPHLPAK